MLRSIIWIYSVAILWALVFAGCSKKPSGPPQDDIPGLSGARPDCNCTRTIGRSDWAQPQTVDTAHWGLPQKVDSSINTNCPEDAIEISRDGQTLYFMFTTDVLNYVPVSELLQGENGTYYAVRTGGPGEFSHPLFMNLRKGAAQGALDGELSFAPSGDTVYFHSLRLENTGLQQNPPIVDPMDIYAAALTRGVPGPAWNLGAPVNSVYLDGEHCISPDGSTLYFSSNRPGGNGKSDIYASAKSGSSWSTPVNLGAAVNTGDEEKQPAFAAQSPDTMYFVSDRDNRGQAIYRTVYSGGSWLAPELVIQGQVGEPTLPADGSVMYFVHVLADTAVFGADIYFVQRK
jgi:hypothetical protein